jgi:aryl-alcohol dehydrogenase-like predicted oxidoreductase
VIEVKLFQSWPKRYGLPLKRSVAGETTLVRMTASARFLYAPAPPEITARTRAIAAVCGAHGVPLGAAAIQFALGHTAVASVVASFENAQQYAQACAWLATPIPPACWHALRDAGLVGWHPGQDQ